MQIIAMMTVVGMNTVLLLQLENVVDKVEVLIVIESGQT